ncbi:MAG: ABC transporter ATP-binding protein [Ferrimicrobium sp.]|uniref:ABC transporter ATP-binding protein n=1 Tax=Ferrimicrobium sp. TaxID=2926050 RepID=UPI002619EB6D|nr:ABC transporter ATP-binding protein [Ferrimicrobium sp.]
MVATDLGTQNPAIEVKDLVKTYPGAIAAVRGVSFSIPRGSIYGLLGPNGAGKTTTFGMITTRVIPTSGTVMINGIDVVARPAQAKGFLGVVPQSNTLDRSLSVRENLTFHGRYFGMTAKDARAKADQLLVQFRLQERAAAPVGALSGGMAQRLMVARAVMHSPTILVLDEPTTGLDPQSRLALWEILRELNTAGQTILLSTHYMDEADELCEKIAIMDHGQVLALDTPAALKRSYAKQAQISLDLQGADPEVATMLARALPNTTVSFAGTQLTISTDDPTDLLPMLVKELVAMEITYRNLSVRQGSLESVFLALTGRDLRE